MDKSYKKKLQQQGYYFTGEHSASKICTWTKKSLRDEGFCYKQKFYGINSHLCNQMSVTVNFCNNNCLYCWRERNNSDFGKIDEPIEIINNSIIAQRKLISGYGGYEKLNKKKFIEAQNPKHYAISLTGETLAYPKLNELIKLLHKKNMSTFIVTNGQLPERLRKMTPPTQLYISISAPTKDLFNKICSPIQKNGWEQLIKSLKILKNLKKRTRTAIRITVIKDLNMVFPQKYAELIKIAEPKFVEVKAYMYVGASREKLTIKNMPTHEEVREFGLKIGKFCNYKFIDEQKESRVILLMKKDLKNRILKFNNSKI
ncbi:MAG: 4-demethylwyosine synthase TYW1 [Candidatus Woesearchaeota archaeon]